MRSISTFTSTRWDHPEVILGAFQFVDPHALASFLIDAGLMIEEQFGDWTREPLTHTSPRIITIARRA